MKDFVVEIFDINVVERLNKENMLSINTEVCETGIDNVKIISKTGLANQIYKFIVSEINYILSDLKS